MSSLLNGVEGMPILERDIAQRGGSPNQPPWRLTNRSISRNRGKNMTTATTNTRTDVYTRVTTLIVEELERGVRSWFKPWNAEHAARRITRPLRHSGQPYRGVNILMLWMSAELNGYACPFWLTFQQAKELGGHVRKNEHGSRVVYASTFKVRGEGDKTETANVGQDNDREIPFLNEYTVFNAEQCEGLPPHFSTLAELPRETLTRIEQAEQFFANTHADMRHGGSRAYYVVGTDYVQMPPLRDVP